MDKETENNHTFSQLGLIPELLQAVAACGYPEPTPIQNQAIPVVLQGRDVIGCAQTGTGKTAAFVLPILQTIRPGEGLQALVLTPPRELALQIETHIQALNPFSAIRSAVVYGGVGILGQEDKLAQGLEFLVATPGRLLDHIWRGNVDFPNLRILVLDEADRMLDMGFLPDIKKILNDFLPRDRQTMLFSATISADITRLARFALRDPLIIQVGRVRPAEGVQHGVYTVRQEQKYPLLTRLLRQMGPEDPVMVFTRSKIGAERLAGSLHRSGFDVTALHSDRNQTQRERALLGFRDRRYQVLVATDVASRGLDIEGIVLIVNYDVPLYAEDYVHRVGRTARVQATGLAYTLATPEEQRHIQAIEKFIGRPLPRLEMPGGPVEPAPGRPVVRTHRALQAPSAPAAPVKPHPRAGRPQEGRPASGVRRPVEAPPRPERPLEASPKGTAPRQASPLKTPPRAERSEGTSARESHRRQAAVGVTAPVKPKRRPEQKRSRPTDTTPIITYQDRLDTNRRRWQPTPNPIIEDAYGSGP